MIVAAQITQLRAEARTGQWIRKARRSIRRFARGAVTRSGPVLACAVGTSACARDGVPVGTSGPRRGRAPAMTAPPAKKLAGHQKPEAYPVAGNHPGTGLRPWIRATAGV